MFSAKKFTGTHDVLALLNCRRLPGRLTAGETAAILGFQEHDITVLITTRCLVPLGKPANNAPKYFAAVDVLKLAQDREWLSRATRTISKTWSEKNSRKKSAPECRAPAAMT